MSTDPFAKFEEFGNPFEQKKVTPNPGVDNTTDPFAQFESAGNPFGEKQVDKEASDFIPGIQRGMQNLQASAYGVGALAGKGLQEIGFEEAGKKLQNAGLEGYNRNITEAEQYAPKNSFKDVYTGKSGMGGAIDWAQGTLGELVPSMVEAAIGAATGSLMSPGVGTATGAFAGRTILKKSIDEIVKKTVKEGTEKAVEDQIRKQVTSQALKKLGGKVGMGAAVFPMETGGMYAELLNSHGVDAPGTAMLFGSLATAMEYAGGNSKLVDTFVDALAKGATGMAKKSAKEILTNIPQEAMQEGGQELMNVLNTVVNTDEKLLTGDNLERIIESMAAGAVGGGAGAGASYVAQSQQAGKQFDLRAEQETALNKQVDNIFSFGEEKVNTTLQTLQDNVAKNAELLGNQEALDKYAMSANIAPDILIKQLVDDNNRNNALIQGIQKRFTDQQLAKDQEIANLSPEQKQILDIQNNIKTQREESALNINEQINGINEQLKTLRQQAAQEQDVEKRNLLYENVFGLIDNRDALLDKQKQVVATTEFTEPKKADEIRQEKEAFYNQLWPGGVNKDAVESAQVFNEKTVEQQDILDRITTQIANTQDVQKKQELQKVYDGLFQTFERDANEAAQTFQTQDLSQFDQMVKAKDQERLNNFINSIVVEQNPQARQTMYEQLFMEPRIKDAAESAAVFASQGVDADMLQRRKELQQTISNITQESDPTVRQQLYNQIFLQPGVKNAEESAEIFNENIQIIDQQEEDRKQREGEQFYNEIFAQNQQPVNPGINNEVANKTAEESAKTFEQAGMGNGQTSPFTNERQVELTDNQQIIVDKNNFEIAKLKQNYNTTIDRNERINVLNQIDELEKINSSIRTPVENTWSGAEDYFTLNKEGEEGQTYFQLENNQKEPANFTFNNGKLETSLGTIINQVKSAEGLTGQLAKFLGDFIASSKLDIKTIIDPTIPSANYTGGKINTITLRDPSQFATSLHEITHAVTSREMKANPAIRKQVFLLMKRVENKAIKEALITPAQLELLRTARTSKEYKENISTEFKYGNVAYGLLNENEFLAQAIGSEQFQRLLKATTIADQGMLKNAWDAFVEIVLNALGIQQTNKNAFGEALNLIAKLASQENVEQTSNSFVLENFESPEIGQKIPDSTYNQMFNERNNLVRKIGQTLRMRGTEFKQLLDKGFGSISTRLKNVDPMLYAEIRNLDFRTSQRIVSALRIAHPLLEATKRMSPEDKFVWDAARRNSDEVKIKQIATKYGIAQAQEDLRTVLDQIRQDAIDVGYDVGFIDEYWPRIIKDQEGFLQATKGISNQPVFSNALKVQADKLGLSVDRFQVEYPEVAADIISNTIFGRNLGLGGPGNVQARQYETVPPELNKYYMDSDAALMQYIYSMTKKIEVRRFFGKVPERIAGLKAEKKRKDGQIISYNEILQNATPEEKAELNKRINDLSGDLIRIEQELYKYKLQRDYTENIGAYIDDLILTGRISKDEERIVRNILDARFNEHGTTGLINAYKNIAYIDVMGSPISAITQIGDLAWAMYVGKVWTPRGLSNTVKNISKATTGSFKNSKYLSNIYTTFGGSEITKEDLGIERIAQEFADGTTLGNAVSWVFKKVGLEKMDSIGKEALINNALDNYKAMVQTEDGRTSLTKYLKPIFGSESDGVIQDLVANNHSDNVKMLLYHRLLDFQPVALSEMPEQYLKSGNGRIFYMLKTYTLKQFDVFRNEAWHKIKTGERDQVIEGIGNMIKLTSLLALANAGADELKDLLLGKDVKFKDHVIENFITMSGASRYVKMQIKQDGLGAGLIRQILPPFKFIDALSKDVAELRDQQVAGDILDFNQTRIVESLPVGGKLYYWHYGRGEDYKKSANEQSFKELGTETSMFKRQLENAEDKRNFIYANIGKFKQMKLHENFQSALSRNQAVINKLKKVPETTNVIERLGKLKEQREVLLDRYFEASKGLNTSN